MKSIAFSLLVALLVVGCSEREVAAPAEPPVVLLPTTQMTLGGQTFTLEIADEPEETERGLMFRKSLEPNRGMIFVFPDERVRGFWMQNVPISLDIAYVDRNGVVVSVLTMYPMDINTRSSIGPAMYAIEIPGGRAKEINLKPGDRVEIPAALRPPADDDAK